MATRKTQLSERIVEYEKGYIVKWVDTTTKKRKQMKFAMLARDKSKDQALRRAKKKMRELITQDEQQLLSPRERARQIKITELFNDYGYQLEARTKGKDASRSDSTYTNFMCLYNGYIKDVVENMTCDQLTSEFCGDFFRSLAKMKYVRKGYQDRLLSNKSRKEIWNVFTQVLNEAYRNGKIVDRPHTQFSFKSYYGDLNMKEVNPPTEKDVQALLEASNRWQPLLSTMVMTGLRIGEATGLMWKHIDLNNSQIHVRQQLNKNGVMTEKLKTNNSRRSVPMPNQLVNILVEHQLNSESNDDDLVFTSTEGKQISQNNFRDRHFYKWQRDLKLLDNQSNPKYRIHDIRHFYATYLISHGAPVNEVSRNMGHSSAKITLDTYTHYFDQQNENSRAVNSLNSLTNNAANIVHLSSVKGTA